MGSVSQDIWLAALAARQKLRKELDNPKKAATLNSKPGKGGKKRTAWPFGLVKTSVAKQLQLDFDGD